MLLVSECILMQYLDTCIDIYFRFLSCILLLQGLEEAASVNSSKNSQ